MPLVKLDADVLTNIFQELEKNCAVHQPVFDSSGQIIDCLLLAWNEFFADKRKYEVRQGQSMVEFYADPDEALKVVNKAWIEGSAQQEFNPSHTRSNNHYCGSENYVVEVFWQKIAGHIVELSGPHTLAHQSVDAKLEVIEIEHDIETRAQLSDERNRISRDLHDSVIQQIYAATIGLKRSISSIQDLSTKENIEKVIQMLGDVIVSIREEVVGISEGPIDDIENEVRKIAKIYTENSDLAVFVTCEGELHIPSIVAAHVRSVLKEATSNAVRHGKASRIDVSFEKNNEQFSMKFTDNGIGFGNTPKAGNGLENMKFRAQSLGGSMNVLNHNLGTTLNWAVPSNNMNWRE
jgi:signal transduction histidine kinase